MISYLREVNSILIIGPGEAKSELKTHLEGEALSERIVGIEAADKMTDKQIAAAVRKHLGNSTKV